jgi:putative ABC transport system ATP-binding protein
VFIDGLDTAGMSDRALSGVRSRNVGFVFQDYFLLPAFSATENVENGLLYSGTPASERTERARAMLERVGLSDRMRHLPKELSGGEQQRVAIARALVHDPSFVLADEPTGSVDSRNTASLLELLVSLNDEGTTVILVTHDLEVAAMTGRQVALKDGRVEADSGAIAGRAHG